MLVVRVAARIRPGSAGPFIAQLQKEAEEVPASFAGCERFDAYVDPADDHRVLLYEEWASREAFEAYQSSPYFAEAGAILRPLIDGAPDSAYFAAERIGP